MVLNSHTLIVGSSQRTTPGAIEVLAKNLFFKAKSAFDTIIVLSIPKARTFMHLDTIFTQVDVDKFTIHKGILKKLELHEISKGDKLLRKRKYKGSLESLLEKYFQIIFVPHYLAHTSFALKPSKVQQ